MAINREAKRYLYAQFFYRFGLFFSHIFLVIFLWKGNQSLDQLALFFLLRSIAILFTYYPSSLFARWTSPLTAFRLGVSLYGISYAILLIFYQSPDGLFIWIGILSGVAESLWSVGTHVLTMDLIANDQRDSFSHYHYIFTSLSEMIAPFLAGALITSVGGIEGYFAVFFITILFFIGSVLVTFLLRIRTYPKESRIFKILTIRSKPWNQLLQASFLWVGAESLLKPFLLVMALYFLVESEWWVGTLMMISSLFSILASFFYAQVITPQNRHRYYFIAALLLFLFMILLYFKPDFWSIVLIMIVVGATTPALDIPMNTVMYEVIDAVADSKEQRLDFITVREIPLGFGRIFSLLFFLYLMKKWINENFLYFMLIILSGFYLMVYGWIRKRTYVTKNRTEDIETHREKTPSVKRGC